MIERLKSILNQKSIKNGVWLYLLQFFNMVVPLLTLPYITRILGSSVYGTFSIALNIVGYLQVIVEYGFSMSATRKAAINGREGLDKTFTTVVLGRVLLLLLCLGVSIVYALLNRDNIQLVISFFILFTCLFGYCVQMNWVFQGMQEMKYISIVNVIGRTVSTILIFVFVKSQNDLFLYCLLYSISPFLSGFIGLVLAQKKYKLHFIKVHFSYIINELKEGFFIFTTQLSSKVFGAIGVTFLGIYATSSEVGIFSAIQKIPNILILLWTPITQVFYPISSQHFKSSFDEGIRFVKKAEKIFLPIFIVIALSVGVLGKFVISLLYGTEYTLYYYWLFPLLTWMVVAIANNFLGIQTLLGSGHDKEYGEAFQISICITISLNWLLTKFLGGLGAAFAPLLSEMALYLLLRWKTRALVKKQRTN